MKKIFRILFNILSTLIILAITLPLILALLLRINAVQNYVVQYLTQLASEKVETTVSIGHVDIKNLYTINFSDIYVADPLEKDTLLFVSKLSSGAFSLGVATDGVITFDKIEVKKGIFHLNTYDSGGTNMKYILDKLKSSNKEKSDVKLLFKDIIIDSITFAYSKQDSSDVEYGVDFKRLRLNHISGEVKNLYVKNDTITAKVDGLRFTERSGLKMKEVSVGAIYLSPDSMVYSSGRIRVENSFINFAKFKMSYKNWTMSDFVEKVPLNIDVTSSSIDFKDVAKFTKKEQKWQSFVAFSGTFNGPVSDFKGEIRRASTNSTVIERAKYQIKNVPDVKNMIFDISIGMMETNFDDIYFGANDFSKKKIPSVTDLSLSRKMLINGYFRGKTSDFKSFVEMRPLIGKEYGAIDLKMSMNGSKISVNGNVKTDNLNISSIVKNNVVKNVTANVNLSGYVSKNDFMFKTNGVVDRINIVDRVVKSIKLNGDFQNKTFLGDVSSSDESLKFDFNGLVDLNSKQPSYNFDLNLENADLVALKLFERDSISKLRAHILVNGMGVKLDDLSLQATIDNLNFISTKVDTVDVKERLNLVVRTNDQSKFLELKSGFADLTLKGVLSYETIVDYIKYSISSYLPVFQKDAYDDMFNENIVSLNKDDFYVVKLDVKKTTQLFQIFAPDLVLAEGTKILFTFNPLLRTHSLNVNSSFVSYKDNMLSNLSISSANKSDSLSVFISADEILYNNIYIPNLSLINNISHDRISLSAGYTNEKNSSKVLINSEGIISRDSSGNIILSASILPSYYKMGDLQWNIVSGDFVIAEERTVINELEVVSKGESLKVDGAISKSPKDTLNLTLNNFDISPTSLLLKNIGFLFDGKAWGKINLTALTSKENMKIFGLLTASQFKVNGAAIEDFNIYLSWNDYLSRADIRLATLESGKEIVDGFFSPSENKFSLQLKFDDISPKVISPFVNGIVSNIYGSTTVDMNLSNNNDKRLFMINGDVLVNLFSAKVDYTNAIYKASGSMSIRDNVFTMNDAVVKDTLGGNGVLALNMAINKTRGFEFDININPNNLLALNSTQKMSPMFYGTLFATGNVRIRSVSAGVSLVANVETAKNSKFFLPLSYNSQISEVDFIKYVPRVHKDEKSLLWDLKKSREVSKSAIKSSLDIVLNAKILPNTEIEIVVDPVSGSSINSRGVGDFVIRVNPQRSLFTINGDYSITKGNYHFILPNINLINKNFMIKEGSWINFNGDPLNATLDVNAIYKVKASLAPLSGANANNNNKRVNVDCVMNIKGSLLKPDIVLGVDVLNADPETNSIVRSALSTQEEITNQFIFLLLSNSFTSSGASSSGGDLGRSGIVTGVEFLTNKIENILSSDKFMLNLNYRPKDTYTSDEFGIGFSTPLLGDKLFLDVEGNFNLKNNSAALGTDIKTLSGDFNLTWVLNEFGNLRLKAFSRPMETFDENQGKQESGIGIYYTEEFDSIKELISNYKQYAIDRKKRRELKRVERSEKKIKRDEIKEEKKIKERESKEELKKSNEIK